MRNAVLLQNQLQFCNFINVFKNKKKYICMYLFNILFNKQFILSNPFLFIKI